MFFRYRCLYLLLLLLPFVGKAQLSITDQVSAQVLAQRLVGEGVNISNVTYTGSPLMSGTFVKTGIANIGIDSGIVLTTGRAKTAGTVNGLNGINNATLASSVRASNNLVLPGDAPLAGYLGVSTDSLKDACVLEFDFTPLGDTIRFRYSFCSEEYTSAFVCRYNDVFGFFISGPGIAGVRNIALIPNTTLPVTILNVNNVLNSSGVAPCPNNIQYFVNNASSGSFFTHDGITTVLTAVQRVQPCQTYHLRLVISDFKDGLLDSGVFLEAKSLSSNFIQLQNATRTDANGASYVVEGCTWGGFDIKRNNPDPYPLNINLNYSGTAVNGTDVQLLPATVTIPANDTIVHVPVFPIADNIAEPNETVVVKVSTGCSLALDSAVIVVKDYDTLGVTPPVARICRNNSIQLQASNGYDTYSWTSSQGLPGSNVQNPVFTPTADSTYIICVAAVGQCRGTDTINVYWKKVNPPTSTGVNCQGGTTGTATLTAGAGWTPPLIYTINGQSPQPSGTFTNLSAGTYWLAVQDAGCKDSVQVTVSQLFPNLVIDSVVVVKGYCDTANHGSLTIFANGGSPPYLFASNGSVYQSSSLFSFPAGTYNVSVKDNNGCVKDSNNVVIGYINDLTLSTLPGDTICESDSSVLHAITNGGSVLWSPGASLSNPAVNNPVSFATQTTQYYVTAAWGPCTRRDSVTLVVNPAPLPNAGDNITVCYGGSTILNGSGGVAYTWQPATYLSDSTISNPSVVNPSTITYTLSVVSDKGCASLVTDNVLVTVLPPAKLFAGNDTSVAVNQPLQLQAIDINNTGFTSYYWTPGTNLDNPFIAGPIGIFTQDEVQLIATGVTAGNCIGRDTIVVKAFKGPEIYVPTAFSPNGDGLNDIIRAFPVGVKKLSYFTIFNRWGHKIFTTSDTERGWDGTVSGKTQSIGSVFVWIASGIDYKGQTIIRKGTFTLLK